MRSALGRGEELDRGPGKGEGRTEYRPLEKRGERVDPPAKLANPTLCEVSPSPAFFPARLPLPASVVTRAAYPEGGELR